MSGRPHPAHRAAPQYDPNVIDVTMRCNCGTIQEQKLDADERLSTALAGCECMFCGSRGQMKLVRS